MTGGSSGGPWLLNASAGIRRQAQVAQLLRLLGRQEHVRPDLQRGDRRDLRRRHSRTPRSGDHRGRTVGRPLQRITRRPAATPAFAIRHGDPAAWPHPPQWRATPTARRGSMTTTRRRPDPLLMAGLAVAVLMLVLVVAGSDPTIDVTEPFCGQARHGAGRPLLLRAEPLPTCTRAARTGTRSARTRTRRRSPSSSTRSTCCRGPSFVAAWTAILHRRRLAAHRSASCSCSWASSWARWRSPAATSRCCSRSRSWPGSATRGRGRSCCSPRSRPGIGLLWFALRREWRQLAIALGATAAVVAVSFLLMPGAWRDWIALLAANTGKGGTWAAVPDPARDPRADRRGAASSGARRATSAGSCRSPRCSRCRPSGTARCRCSWA